MRQRLGLLLLLGIVCASASASASETYVCTYTVSDEPLSGAKHATIEINGDDLVWKLDAIKTPEMSVPSTSFHHHILENNDVGIVAVLPEAMNKKPFGEVVRADVVTLTKSNLNFRMGVIGTYPAHDLLTGKCQKK